MSSDAPLGATPARPAIEKKRPELADIFALHGEAFHRDHPLPSRHLNVMRRLLLKLLFDCVAEALLELGRGELGGQVGFTSVLHTWDQKLRPQ